MSIRSLFGALLLMPALMMPAFAADDTRHQLLDAVELKGADAVPRLTEALADDKPVVRRTAAHLIAYLGASARTAFDEALASPDVQVRHIMVDALIRLGLVNEYWPALLVDEAPSIQWKVRFEVLPAHPLPEGAALERIMKRLASDYAEASVERRGQVVRLFTSLDKMTAASRRILIEAATRDLEPGIRENAYEALLPHVERDWPQAQRLIETALADESEAIRRLGRKLRWKVLSVAQVRFPEKGWRFKADPNDMGRKQKWYAPDYDDTGWKTDVPIEDSWQNHIGGAYHGPAWYRRTIEVPAASDWDQAQLYFGGVDEQAWVWINGQMVGAHAIGPFGWNQPFVLNVTRFIEAGSEHQITIRAQNTKGGGGIWRPVWLYVLDTDGLDH